MNNKEVFGVFLNSDLPTRSERKALFAHIRAEYTCEGFITRQAAQAQAEAICHAFAGVKAHVSEYITVF